VKIYALCIPLLAASQGLFALDCIPNGHSGDTVAFTMVTLKGGGSPSSSYSKGTLLVSAASNTKVLGPTGYSTAHNDQYFSDRVKSLPAPALFYLQPFDAQKKDLIGLSISQPAPLTNRPATITLTAETAGNTKSSFTAACDATTGVIYGSVGNNTFVAITLGAATAPPAPPN
jgi:hypothetical protein